MSEEKKEPIVQPNNEASGENKPAEGKPEATNPADVIYPKDEAAPGAEAPKDDAKPAVEEPKPSESDIELKLPEKAAIDAKAVEAIKAFAKENGLNQKQAQAIVDRENALETGRHQSFNALHDKFYDEVVADKEVGGEAFKEHAAHAKRAVDMFATPGLKKLLEGPYGSQIDVVKTFAAIGKKFANDTAVHGSTKTVAPRTREHILFPDMK